MQKHLITVLGSILAFQGFTALHSSAQSVPPLINYQGRLSDQSGEPLPAGQYGILFRIWDDGTATNATDLLWGQQYTNIALQSNGVFNLILGAPGGSNFPGATNSLASAFAGSNCFLGVTIVVSNGMPISSASEIVPRQQLLTVPFAFNAASASTASIASSVIPGSIVNTSLAVGAVQSTNLANGAVTLANLAPRPVHNPASVGGVAVGAPTSFNAAGPNEPIPGSSITITTTGRPVLILLIAANPPNASAMYGGNAGDLAVQRDDGAIVGKYSFSQANGWITVPASLVFLDTPTNGVHSYWLYVTGSLGNLSNAKLVGLEL